MMKRRERESTQNIIAGQGRNSKEMFLATFD